MTTGKALAMPMTFEETKGLAAAFVASGMFSDTKQLNQAIVKIVAGQELGLPAVYSMQNINLIRNRLTTSANTLAMLVKRSGKYNYHVKEHTDVACTIIFSERYDDKWLEVGTSKFTIDDARRADLVKPDSGWIKYPRAMLFSRAISQGARIYCPDAIGGVYTDEEIRSIPPRYDDTVDTATGEIAEAAAVPGEAPAPVAEEPPATVTEEEVHVCPIHGSLMHERTGKNGRYFSHAVEGKQNWYCNGVKEVEWKPKAQ